MEEFENGNTKIDEETHEIEPKGTPYGISDKGIDIPETENEIPVENEDANKEILVTEVGADYAEPLTSYSEEPANDTKTEVIVENETEPDLEEINKNYVLPVAETEASDANIGPSTEIGAVREFVFEENIPSSENSKNVEEDHNTPVHTEDREIEQPLISGNGSLAQRTSWGSCCGLFQFLRRSND